MLYKLFGKSIIHTGEIDYTICYLKVITNKLILRWSCMDVCGCIGGEHHILQATEPFSQHVITLQNPELIYCAAFCIHLTVI